jgi:hypothetical protein
VQRVHDKAVHPAAEIYELPVEIEWPPANRAAREKIK